MVKKIMLDIEGYFLGFPSEDSTIEGLVYLDVPQMVSAGYHKFKLKNNLSLDSRILRVFKKSYNSEYHNYLQNQLCHGYSRYVLNTENYLNNIRSSYYSESFDTTELYEILSSKKLGLESCIKALNPKTISTRKLNTMCGLKGKVLPIAPEQVRKQAQFYFGKFNTQLTINSVK